MSRMKTTHTPSFLHLKNTHRGCFGVPKVSRSTIRVQSSHCMSGIGEPQSLCASAEPGGRSTESMPANRRRREDEPTPACGGATLLRLREMLPDHSIAWHSHRRPEKPNPTAHDEGPQIRNFPARRRRMGRGAEGNLVCVAAFRRAPAGYFRRNLGRRPSGGARGRGEVVGGEKRGLKCPPHQSLPLYTGH